MRSKIFEHEIILESEFNPSLYSDVHGKRFELFTLFRTFNVAVNPEKDLGTSIVL